MTLKPIKKIAGDLLLYFYALQRARIFSFEIINFTYDGHEMKAMSGNPEITKGILEICENSLLNAYNGLEYLAEKGFLAFKTSEATGTYLFHGIRVTAPGVDIVEGIERGDDERKEFNVNFNFDIKLADNISVESLIKAELGSLIKASLI